MEPHLTIHMVLEDIETGNGTGLKLLISKIVINQPIGINIQLYFWEHLCLLSVEGLIRLVKQYHLKFMIQKVLNGIDSKPFKDLDVLYGY